MIFNKLSQDRRNWLFGVTVLFILCIAVAPREPYCARCGTNIQERWSLPRWAYSLQLSPCTALLMDLPGIHSPYVLLPAWPDPPGATRPNLQALFPHYPQQRKDQVGGKFRAELLALFCCTILKLSFNMLQIPRLWPSHAGFLRSLLLLEERWFPCSQCPQADRGVWIKGSLFSGLCYILFLKMFCFAFSVLIQCLLMVAAIWGKGGRIQ